MNIVFDDDEKEEDNDDDDDDGDDDGGSDEDLEHVNGGSDPFTSRLCREDAAIGTLMVPSPLMIAIVLMMIMRMIIISTSIILFSLFFFFCVLFTFVYTIFSTTGAFMVVTDTVLRLYDPYIHPSPPPALRA